MKRRDFLKAMLIAGAAPAIVKASSIMPIWLPPEKKIITGRIEIEKLYEMQRILDEANVPIEGRMAYIPESWNPELIRLIVKGKPELRGLHVLAAPTDTAFMEGRRVDLHGNVYRRTVDEFSSGAVLWGVE